MVFVGNDGRLFADKAKSPNKYRALDASAWSSLLIGDLFPHAAHARAEIDLDPWLLARVVLERRTCPGRLLEGRQHRCRDEAGARGIDMAVAARRLVVRIKALRHHQMQAVLGPRHRHIEQPAFFLDVLL